MINGVNTFITDGLHYQMKAVPDYWKKTMTAKYGYGLWWPIFKDENEFREFIEVPIDIVYWRNLERVGQWIQADNGNIGYVIKERDMYINKPERGKNIIYSTSFGEVYKRFLHREDFWLYPSIREVRGRVGIMLALNGRRPLSRKHMKIDEYLSLVTRLTGEQRNFLDIVGLMILTNPMGLTVSFIVSTYEDMMAPSKYGKQRVLKYAWALLGNKRAREHMSDLVKQKAKEIDIDEDFVLKGMKKIAEESNSDKVKLESLMEIGKLIGMYDQGQAPDEGYVAGVLIGTGNQAQLGAPPMQLSPADEIPDGDFTP